MKGNIIASGKVEITREADFFGKIKSKRIAVEHGAYLDAYVDLGEKASRTAAPKRTLTKKPIDALV